MKSLLVITSVISFLIGLYFLVLEPFTSDSNNVEACGTMLTISAFLLSRWIIVENRDNELLHH